MKYEAATYGDFSATTKSAEIGAWGYTIQQGGVEAHFDSDAFRYPEGVHGGYTYSEYYAIIACLRKLLTFHPNRSDTVRVCVSLDTIRLQLTNADQPKQEELHLVWTV